MPMMKAENTTARTGGVDHAYRMPPRRSRIGDCRSVRMRDGDTPDREQGEGGEGIERGVGVQRHIDAEPVDEPPSQRRAHYPRRVHEEEVEGYGVHHVFLLHQRADVGHARRLGEACYGASHEGGNVDVPDLCQVR